MIYLKNSQKDLCYFHLWLIPFIRFQFLGPAAGAGAMTGRARSSRAERAELVAFVEAQHADPWRSRARTGSRKMGRYNFYNWPI